MDEKFTVQEFKNYVMKQDSLGDVAYNLNAENIKRANAPEEQPFDDDDWSLIEDSE